VAAAVGDVETSPESPGRPLHPATVETFSGVEKVATRAGFRGEAQMRATWQPFEKVATSIKVSTSDGGARAQQQRGNLFGNVSTSLRLGPFLARH